MKFNRPLFARLKLHGFLTVNLIVFLLMGCNQTAGPSPEVLPTSTRQSIYYSNTVVSLTFDDGDADNYQIRDVLKANDLHATFYVVSGFTGTAGYMTGEQLQGLYQDGNEIGGHTLNHTKLSEVRGAELKTEICQDRLNLLAQGFVVTSFAYPYGFHDEESRAAVADCGYNSARIVGGGPETFVPENLFTLRVMPYIVQDTSFSKMTRYVSGVETEGGGWVIFVFHHVCDGCDEYAVSYDTFSKFASWLGRQQQMNGLKIKTINEVIGGEVLPGVNP
jgi:peptidoglycan/xylan/chitin deacetylase (PgdA/CDA1 family)